MIYITTKEASEYALILAEKPESRTRRLTRRVSVVSTLDAGSVAIDSGYSDTDRRLVIEADATEAQADILESMIQNYSALLVSLPDGCFTVLPADFALDNGAVQITLLIAE